MVCSEELQGGSPQMKPPQFKCCFWAPQSDSLLPLFRVSSCNNVHIKFLLNITLKITHRSSSLGCFLFRPGFLLRPQSCKYSKHVSHALDFWELLTCLKMYKCPRAGRSWTCIGIEQAFKSEENHSVNKLLVNWSSSCKQNHSNDWTTKTTEKKTCI